MLNLKNLSISNFKDAIKRHKEFLYALIGFYVITIIFIILNYETVNCDRDDAIIIFLNSLFKGENPYSQDTPFGIPVGGGGRFPMNFLFFLPFYLVFGFSNMTVYAMALVLPTIIFIFIYKRVDTSKRKNVYIFMILWTVPFWWLNSTFYNYDLYIPILLGCLRLFLLPEKILIPLNKDEQSSNFLISFFQKIIPKKEFQLEETRNYYFSFILAGISVSMRIFCFIFPVIVIIYSLRCYGFKSCIKGILIMIAIVGCSILPFLLMDPTYFLQTTLWNSVFFSEWNWVFLSIILPFGSYNSYIITGFCLVIIIILSLWIDNKFGGMLTCLIGFGILYFFICFSSVPFLGSTFGIVSAYSCWIAIPIIFLIMLYEKN